MFVLHYHFICGNKNGGEFSGIKKKQAMTLPYVTS